jgi:hypothetical protein
MRTWKARAKVKSNSSPPFAKEKTSNVSFFLLALNIKPIFADPFSIITL